MQKLYTVIRLLLLPAMMLAVTSCLTEDTSDCPDGSKVRIMIRTIAEATQTGTTVGQIENVIIYIFDGHERFAGSWHGGSYTYGQPYVAEPDLIPGTYHFVVWTNQGEIYDKTKSDYGTDDPAQDLVISMKYPSDGTITNDIADLHHGMLAEAEVIGGIDNEFTVILRPNTYKLNFTVEGLPPTDDDYTFTVRDNYMQFLFDNSIIEQRENQIEYIRTTGFDSSGLGTSMKVLKIIDGRTPQFVFANLTTGEALYSNDLVEMIKKAYNVNGRQVDFDTEFEFDITLRFDAWLGVTIAVNGWNYNPNEEIIGG